MPRRSTTPVSPSRRYSPRSRKGRSGRQPKGAPRAKSGCITCRIRRKKCDERIEGEGEGCTTCHRLHLECLGFSPRRPEWLRDPTRLDETREGIKRFLTENGLVRGQNPTLERGASIRILKLSPDDRALSMSPTPSLAESQSVTSEEGQRHVVSSVREEPFWPQTQTHYHDDAPYPLVDGQEYSDSVSSGAYYEDASNAVLPQSSFGDSYNLLETSISMVDDQFDCNGVIPYNLLPLGNEMYQFFPTLEQTSFLKHYLSHVVKIQYLLADDKVHQHIWVALQGNRAACEAACLLAALHQHRMNNAAGQGAGQHALLLGNLQAQASMIFKPNQGCMSEGDVLAALQVISCYLFVGGRGSWYQYLDYATDWVQRLFDASNFKPAETLARRTDLEQFIIKTTMWFDVLASVTRFQPPRLYGVYLELFAAPATDSGAMPTSMLSVMGCENEIVLALAQISWLSAWKAKEAELHRLSTPTLVKYGQHIEQLLSVRPVHVPEVDRPESAKATYRRLTSAVFRASARVYLHSVLSGDLPACPEIRLAVEDTIACLEVVPHNERAERSVVRMTVFSLCVAGCLTDDAGHRQFLLGRLQHQQAESVGNCAEVRKVMERVWARRDANGGMPVSWRHEMMDSVEGLLLLV